MIEERTTRRETLAIVLIAVTVAVILMALPGLKRRTRSGFAILIPLSATAEAAEINLWKQSVLKVKEDRGEPTGKQAKITVPPQLGHYSDTRRFLAIQVAEWKEHQFETPTDFVGLARLIRKGELVSLKPVTEDYILFGVGGNAEKDPFTHYEKSSGKRLSLYSASELRVEYARLADSFKNLEDEIDSLRQELKEGGKLKRSERLKLQAQITQKEKAVKAERERKELLDAGYGDAERERQILGDYETLENLAKDFSGRTFDLTDPNSRREMKVRMLSALRPEALKVMEEIAYSYRQKFDRPLPLSSLIRPDEYQHELSKVNPNATLIATPPHSTGLAFDVYNRYMTAEEQSHVMTHLARLEDEGRIEVLRENRDHYHVFAFIDGVRPDEALIIESLGRTAPVKSLKSEVESERVSRKEEKSSERKGDQKKRAKKENTLRHKRR
ncbi:MAG: hypothetical protein H0W99_09910 [Acidobacteria bacterium]|nr:hypothetical protein [Acidobacteriota bacterium]